MKSLKTFLFLSSVCFSLLGEQSNAKHQGQEAGSDQIFPFPLKENEQYKDFVFLENVFTPEECQKIIKFGCSLDLNHGEVGNNDTDPSESKNFETRKSKIAWISWNTETNWIFQRLYEKAIAVNDEYYHFDLAGFYENIQFTEYTSPDSHYTWHIDGGEKEFSTRKLSIVVQLSNPKDYEGGELQLFTDTTYPIEKKQGASTFFPSYNPHRVTPITKGKRYTLVVWVSGPPFK